MTSIHATVTAKRHTGLRISEIAKSLLDAMYAWQRTYVERRRMLETADRMLADMGITRTQALREAARLR